MSFSSLGSLSSLSSLLTSAAVVSAIAFAPACSSGDVPIGQDGTSTRNGSGSGGASDAGDAGGGGGGGSTDAGEPATCTTDSDCTGGDLCGYPIAAVCAATGQCFPKDMGAECNAIVEGCACDGTTVSTGCNALPSGYASKPVAEANQPCGAKDGGAAPLPTTCRLNGDCGVNAACGYKESDACAANGTCFAVTGAECASIVPACGCDGNIYNTVCTGLPDGYTLAPVVYPLESRCPTDGG